MNSSYSTISVIFKLFTHLFCVQVNDHLTFPMDLNMFPYTEEGIAAKENKKFEKHYSQDEEDGSGKHAAPVMTDAYYQYTLKGSSLSICFMFMSFSWSVLLLLCFTSLHSNPPAVLHNPLRMKYYVYYTIP